MKKNAEMFYRQEGGAKQHPDRAPVARWHCRPRAQELVSMTQNRHRIFGVATSAEPRGEKKLFLAQILGGEKTFKIW